MIYSGNAISVQTLSDGIAEFKFDLQGESVNKLNRATVQELKEATAAVKADASVKGLIVTSGKSTFIVGADITEFGDNFAQGEAGIEEWLGVLNSVFNGFEDLDIPKVAAINGIAFGGGFEVCLGCEYRVASTAAKVGLPEVKLGLFPGFGGTVRLPRVIGIDNALEWIATGAEKRPDVALKEGAIDAVVAPEKLNEAAIDLVKQALAGKLNWKARRQEKLVPVKLSPIEQMMAFSSAKGVILAKAGTNYPAPKLAIENLEQNVNLNRDEAVKIESKGFAKAAVTPQATALIGVFSADQVVKKMAKKWENFLTQSNKRLYWVRASWVAVSPISRPPKARRS